MFGIGTTELIVMLVVASIMLPRSFRLQSSEVLNRGFRALLGIESSDRGDWLSTVEDICAALLVIALVTITAACAMAMLSN